MIKIVTFKSCNLLLEGVCHYPASARKAPGVLVCHPHTLYGGDMQNIVVVAVCQMLEQCSMVALRFNFRGAGKSQGSFDEGHGEQEDLKAALDYLSSLDIVDPSRIGLAGYSFGASVALSAAPQLETIKAIALISPPFSLTPGFSSFKNYNKPKLIITGGQDSFIRIDEVKRLTEQLKKPRRLEIVSDTDHFWWNRERIAAQKAADFMMENL